MAVGPNGEILSGEPGAIGEFDSSGRVHPRPIPTSSPIVALAAGREGRVWVLSADQGVFQVGSGMPREHFPIEGSPEGMAIDRGGTLWVTTDAINADGVAVPEVVKLTPGGETHVFRLHDKVERLGQIVVGADGNLWFAEQRAVAAQSARVARLDPTTSQITSWSVGSPRERVLGVAASSSAVWFTVGKNEVGRIGYSGRIKMFSRGIPAGAFPDAITAGPDGAMWFTELGADAIGEIAANGRVTQFPWAPLAVFPSPVPGGTCGGPCVPGGADAIVRGPGQTLWFSRPGTDEFGRLSVSPRCSVPNLLGLKVSAARRLLGAAGCRLGRTSTNDAAFVVVRQSAAAGRLLPRGATIDVQASSAGSARRACVPSRGQRVVLENDRASLLAALEQSEERGGETPFEYFVCVDGGTGAHLVQQIKESSAGGEYSGEHPSLFTLVGDYLAWQQTSTSYDQPAASISVLDVRTGQLLQSGPLADLPNAVGSEVRATTIALDQLGDAGWLLAWVGSGATPDKAEQLQVQTPAGARTLESGPSGSFGSLRISPAGTLDWSRAGVQHSYVFER
jgi:virginiamycin B lyase